jgi:G patch domain and KOW motifs-containing protein
VARAFALDDESDAAEAPVEYVTGFGADGQLVGALSSSATASSSLASKRSGPPLVIPLLDESSMSTAHEIAPMDQSEDGSRAGLASGANAPAMSLEERAAAELLQEARSGSAVADGGAAAVKVHELPMLMRNRVQEVEEATDEDERYRRDVAYRPEAPTLDAYERVPIAEFGAALLRGMGWADGQCVGRNQNGLAEPILFVKRHHRLGLGATPKDVLPAAATKKYVRPGESREAAPEMEVARGKDGRVRHYRGLDERLVRKKKLEVGCTVYVVDGVHAGLSGRLLQLVDARTVLIRFASGESARLRREHLSLHRSDLDRLQCNSRADHSSSRSSGSRSTGSGSSSSSSGGRRSQTERGEEEESASRKRKAPQEERDSRASSSSSKSSSALSTSSTFSSSSSSSSSAGSSSSKHRRVERERGERDAHKEERESLWMMPKLTVRIVSKSLEGGRLYCKRVSIVDVPSRTSCTVRTDSGRLLEHIKQRHIETALPKVGGTVMVLRGRHRGTTAELLERSSKLAEATVQLSSDLSVRAFSFDDVAEYHA